MSGKGGNQLETIPAASIDVARLNQSAIEWGMSLSGQSRQRRLAEKTAQKG